MPLSTKCQEHELIWSIFASVATSYRADTFLRPFPPQFILDNGQKDIKSLEACVETMPNPSSGTQPTDRQKMLLEWLLSQRSMSVTSRPLSQLKILQIQIGEKLSISEPNYLFEINHTEQKERAFQNLRANRSTFYAYHGSKLENFYSIISHGLHSHLNKTSVFGEGTYLSTEPTVALGFSPWGGTGWKNSVMADSMSIVALCEVIDDPSVKRSTAKKEAERRAPNSVSGDSVPENYVVVTNNDMVRVKYLLVYTKKSSATIPQPSSSSRRSVMLAHVRRHGHTLTMLLYVLLLILISVASSPTFWRKVRQVYEETLSDWVWPSTDSI